MREQCISDSCYELLCRLASFVFRDLRGEVDVRVGLLDVCLPVVCLPVSCLPVGLPVGLSLVS